MAAMPYFAGFLPLMLHRNRIEMTLSDNVLIDVVRETWKG